jgi:hypothetical protein
MEDTCERIFVFFCLGQYNNPIVGVIELEQLNVRKQLFLTACLIVLGIQIESSYAVRQAAPYEMKGSRVGACHTG